MRSGADLFGGERGGERAAGRGGRGHGADAGLRAAGALDGLQLVHLRELPQQERLVVLDRELRRAASRRRRSSRTAAAGRRLAWSAQLAAAAAALPHDHVVVRDARVGLQLARELHVLHDNRDLLLVVPPDWAAQCTRTRKVCVRPHACDSRTESKL